MIFRLISSINLLQIFFIWHDVVKQWLIRTERFLVNLSALPSSWQNCPTCPSRTSWSCRTKWEPKSTTRSPTAATRAERARRRSDWTRTGKSRPQLRLQRSPTEGHYSVCLCFQADGDFSQETSSVPPSGRRRQETGEWRKLQIALSSLCRTSNDSVCFFSRFEILGSTTSLENTNLRSLRRRISSSTTSNTERNRWESRCWRSYCDGRCSKPGLRLKPVCLQMVQKQLKKTKNNVEKKEKLQFLLKRMVWTQT